MKIYNMLGKEEGIIQWGYTTLQVTVIPKGATTKSDLEKLTTALHTGRKISNKTVTLNCILGLRKREHK